MNEPEIEPSREKPVLEYAGLHPSPAASDRLEFCGLRVTPKSLSSIERGHAAVVVPCKTITRIRLCAGHLAPHPILLFVLGLLLIAAGVISLMALFGWLIGGGVFHLPLAAMSAMSIVGGSMLRNSLRRGVYLEVTSSAGRKRLACDAADVVEIEPFLVLPEEAVGVKVER